MPCSCSAILRQYRPESVTTAEAVLNGFAGGFCDASYGILRSFRTVRVFGKVPLFMLGGFTTALCCFFTIAETCIVPISLSETKVSILSGALCCEQS